MCAAKRATSGGDGTRSSETAAWHAVVGLLRLGCVWKSTGDEASDHRATGRRRGRGRGGYSRGGWGCIKNENGNGNDPHGTMGLI